MKYSQLDKIKEKRPVIQSITNHVTVNDCANILLAVGASPIMAHHKKEVVEVQKNAAGLVINLGATDEYESIDLAVASANETGNPVVLDPVGVTTSSYRREFALDLFRKHHIDAVRGNHSEIMALAKGFSTNEGLDSFTNFNDEKEKDAYMDVVKKFSKDMNTILVASGETDLVIDGDTVTEISGGDSIMKHVTGMGCMCSNVVCAFLAVDNSADSAANAIAFYGDCGKLAATKTKNQGTMAFREQFINEVSLKGCLS